MSSREQARLVRRGAELRHERAGDQRRRDEDSGEKCRLRERVVTQQHDGLDQACKCDQCKRDTAMEPPGL